jgi:HSP20 family protein
MFRRFLPDIRKDMDVRARRPRSVMDLMEDMWRAPFEFGSLREFDFPAVNLSEDEKEIKVKAELPGMEAKDIEISVNNNSLVLQGEKKFEDEEKRDNYHRIERSYGTFYRAVSLPSEVDEDKITAKYKHGILEVKLPKSEKSKGKKIEIET